MTKQSAGSLYHQQLARELADFAAPHVARAGGMVALTDVYCLLNRARGAELVSPADLAKAAAELERLQLPVRLRKLQVP